MIKRLDALEASIALQSGLVIAYPTEAVYGLGCDPFNHQAVERILKLKQRSWQKGLIVWIGNWSQLFPLIAEIPSSRLDMIKTTWPGPTTWVFPKSSAVPDWVSGIHSSIAIRMSAHPLAQQLCQNGPIISTSANPQGQEPARSLSDIDHFFSEGLNGVVIGALGSETRPSTIFDVLTQEQLR